MRAAFIHAFWRALSCDCDTIGGENDRILNACCARGELTKEQFEEMRRDLGI